MRPRERNGVRLGQPVRDVDGNSLGKVVRLFDWGFYTRRGLPILSGPRYVLRYDEIRAVRDGALVISRSSRDLLDLAAGEVPHSWRIPTPPAYPTAATPSEARDVRAEVAAGRVTGALPAEAVDHAPPPPADVAPVTDEEVREFVRTRGEGVGPQRAGGDRE